MQYLSELIVDRLPKYCPSTVRHGVSNQKFIQASNRQNFEYLRYVLLKGELTGDP